MFIRFKTFLDENTDGKILVMTVVDMSIVTDLCLQEEKEDDIIEVDPEVEIEGVEIDHVLGTDQVDIEDIGPETVNIKNIFLFILFYYL